MRHCLPLLLIMVLLAVAGCKPTVPSEFIQPNEMEDILYDYHIATALARSQYDEASNVSSQLYFRSVLDKHGVTEADFDSSLVYYYSHIEYLQDIYEHVEGRLTAEANRVGAVTGDINRYSQYGESGDTANIWSGRTEVMLIPKATMNRFDFSVRVDSTFLVGDSFMFQFVSEFLWQHGGKDAVVCMRARYEGDSIVQTVNHISREGTAQLWMPRNDSLKLNDLRGFIYLADGGDVARSRRMMFISQIQLIRFHQQKPKTDEENPADSTKKEDSMQRAEESGRIAVPATSSRTVGRPGDGSPSAQQ